MNALLVTLSLLAAGQAKLSDPSERPQEPAAQAQPQTPPAQPAPPAPAQASAAPAAPAAPGGPPKLVSLLSGETLHGGSVVTAWIGWPSFGIAWGQGITETDDAGLQLDFDYAATELTVGAWYRRALGSAGPFLMSGKFAVSYYGDYDGTLIYSDNGSAQGVQFVPSLLFSSRGGGGIFSLAGDLVMTVTMTDGGGFLFQPRLRASYETSLFDELSVGILGGIGYRVGSGDAPMKDGMVELELLLLATYRIF
jgi:hypothetical protein